MELVHIHERLHVTAVTDGPQLGLNETRQLGKGACLYATRMLSALTEQRLRKRKLILQGASRAGKTGSQQLGCDSGPPQVCKLPRRILYRLSYLLVSRRSLGALSAPTVICSRSLSSQQQSMQHSSSSQ
jgi:hypothetical protein